MYLTNVQALSIAIKCHELNKAYCEAIGDNSQVSWANAEQWQRDSAINGVNYHADIIAKGIDVTPEQSHQNWFAEKERTGWKYGKVKDVVKKEHPCFVNYWELPLEQRIKDILFKQCVLNEVKEIQRKLTVNA